MLFLEPVTQSKLYLVSVNFTIDPAKGIETIQAVPNFFFPGKLIIKDKSKAIYIVKTGKAHLKLWCNRSKLDKRITGAAVVWEDNVNKKWK